MRHFFGALFVVPLSAMLLSCGQSRQAEPREIQVDSYFDLHPYDLPLAENPESKHVGGFYEYPVVNSFCDMIWFRFRPLEPDRIWGVTCEISHAKEDQIERIFGEIAPHTGAKKVRVSVGDYRPMIYWRTKTSGLSSVEARASFKLKPPDPQPLVPPYAENLEVEYQASISMLLDKSCRTPHASLPLCGLMFDRAVNVMFAHLAAEPERQARERTVAKADKEARAERRKLVPPPVATPKRSPDEGVAPESMGQFVDGINQFLIALFREVRQPDQNYVASPFNVSMALGMVSAGARDETLDELSRVLGFSIQSSEVPIAFNELERTLSRRSGQGFQLDITNALWAREGSNYQSKFVDRIGRQFGAELYLIDFEQPNTAAEAINAWAENTTDGRIRDLVTEDQLSDAQLQLTSAIFLDAKWAEPFKRRFTQDMPFRISDERKIDVPTMFRKDQLEYARLENADVVTLPYRGDSAEMVLIHPADLESFEAGVFSYEYLATALGLLEKRKVELYLPKFEIDSSYSLAPELRSMGMNTVFSDTANLTGILDEPVRLNDVLQHTMIAVDEEGTVAASSVSASFAGAAADQPVRVQINSPFLFLIRDKGTGVILFMGRVANPIEK